MHSILGPYYRTDGLNYALFVIDFIMMTSSRKFPQDISYTEHKNNALLSSRHFSGTVRSVRNSVLCYCYSRCMKYRAWKLNKNKQYVADDMNFLSSIHKLALQLYKPSSALNTGAKTKRLR